MRGMRIGPIGGGLGRDLLVAAVATDARRHLGRVGRRRIVVTGGAIESSFDVLVDQEAMAAARPGRRLGNRFQKEREGADEQRNQEHGFSHKNASADARNGSVCARRRDCLPPSGFRYARCGHLSNPIVAALVGMPRVAPEHSDRWQLCPSARR